MRTRTLRGVGAAVLTLGLVTTTFTSAQAADGPTPGATRAPGNRLADHRADALRLLGGSPGKSSLAATRTGITQMSAVCPTGRTLGKVHSFESFEAGLPYPEFSDGFTVETGEGAPDATHWAESSFMAPDPEGIHIVDSNFGTVPQTGKIYLSFSYRGVFDAGSTAALINSDFWEPAPAAEWSQVFLDITSEATTAGDGTMDIAFGHVAPTAGSFDVDNVSVYSCNPPSSGVRGDWTGEGTVDLLATHSDGTLWVYPGNGSGTVKSGVKVGTGWSSFTWQGSPGDVNGDGRTDLLARRSDGTLWFYPGKGDGFFGSRVQVGTGWNAITAIATPGDLDLDGRPDLVARRTDGTLHLYRILANGHLQNLRQIGHGWNGMTSIIGMGDVNGDLRGDLLAVRRDGVMLSYLASSTGLSSARQIGHGWATMTSLSSPGDFSGDGQADLVARRSNGTLWLYTGKAGGTVNSGSQVGTGWNGMPSIL